MKINKGLVEARIQAVIPSGWRFSYINWKKRTVHVTDNHGRPLVVPLASNEGA